MDRIFVRIIAPALTVAVLVVAVASAPFAQPEAHAEPDGNGPPVTMGTFSAEAYADEADELDPGLVAAVGRDLGETGAEYLANAAAAAKASSVVDSLAAEGHSLLGSRIDGTALTVYVDDPDAAAAASAAGATVVHGPPRTVPIDTSNAEPLADLSGGQGWGYLSSSGGAVCSVGFTGMGAGGVAQFLTAGHCFPPGSTIQGSAFVIDQAKAGAAPSRGADVGHPIAGSFHFGDGEDSGLVAVQSGWNLKPQVLTYGGGDGAPQAGTPLRLTDSRSAIVGASLCKSGERTGWTCGSILEVDQDVSVEGNVVNSIIATTCADHGDSGGSAVTGTVAIGMTSAGPDTSAVPCGSSAYWSSYYPMVSAGGKESVNSTQRWEPLVAVNSPVVTAPLNGAVVDHNGVMTGTLANANDSNRVTVTIAGDPGSPRTATMTSTGAWTVDLSGVSLGSHSYTAKASWNSFSESPLVSGSFIVGVDRIAGADRYQVSVGISQRAFSGTAPVVYVATGENYPDALSAAPAAVKQGGPLLLTRGDALPEVVRAEIGRLHPDTIVVVGGPNAVSAGVYGDLAQLAPSIHRIDGADRYAVSRAVVGYAFSSASKAYVATGRTFPDALSASAASASAGYPVVLVDGAAQTVDDATLTLLQDLGVAATTVVGGPAAVSEGVRSALQTVGPSTRVSGPDRFETSIAINRDAFASAGTVYVATGLNFPDALSGAALAGKQGVPIYLAQTNCIPSGALSDLTRLSTSKVTLLGGVNALTDAIKSLVPCSA